MKARYFVSGLVMMALSLCACREITVTTTVHNDGSFTRLITISGDSSDVIKTDLPYPIDTSWTRALRKDSTDTAKFIVTYTKDFRNDGALNSEILADTGWMRQLVRHIDIRKKFGFFYSFIEYREVYSAANPFPALSYKDHVTPEDYLWATRQKEIQNPADSIKRKQAEDTVIAYLMLSASNEIEKILAEGITRLNDPKLDPKKVIQYHDSIYTVLSKWDAGNPGDFIDHYCKWTADSSVLRLRDLKPNLFADFDRKVEFLGSVLMMQDFRVEAELPGVITATNSSVLKGNRMSWDVFPMAFLLEDYKMEAESRVVNLWAFILSGLVLLTLIALLVIRSVRK
jgi:hypothetical protein